MTSIRMGIKKKKIRFCVKRFLIKLWFLLFHVKINEFFRELPLFQVSNPDPPKMMRIRPHPYLSAMPVNTYLDNFIRKRREIILSTSVYLLLLLFYSPPVHVGKAENFTLPIPVSAQLLESPPRKKTL